MLTFFVAINCKIKFNRKFNISKFNLRTNEFLPYTFLYFFFYNKLVWFNIMIQF